MFDLLLLQVNPPTQNPMDIQNQLFSINPTTVYGILTVVLFAAVIALSRFYQVTIKKSLDDKDNEISRLNKVIDNLSSDKDTLNTSLHDISLKNMQTLTKFEQSIEVMLRSQNESNQRMTDTIKQLSIAIQSNLEFNKQLVQQKNS